MADEDKETGRWAELSGWVKAFLLLCLFVGVTLLGWPLAIACFRTL